MTKLPEGLPLRLRLQFTVTRWITWVLKLMRLRGTVLRAGGMVRRAKRQFFEARGSARYAHPALHQMDRKLDAIIDIDDGCFVEAGGHDGYTQSNTYYLERFRGWHGVLVEPMPELAAEARRNRPNSQVFQCALVSAGHGDADIEMEFGDLFTTVRGAHDDDRQYVEGGIVLGWRDHRAERVSARSLSSVLDIAGVNEVDLLSLDVEGYEDQALRGLDLSRHAPAWILVEMHNVEEGRAKVGAVLEDRYVEHEVLSPLDVLYRRSDVEPAARRNGRQSA